MSHASPYAYTESDLDILACLYGGGVLARINDHTWLLFIPQRNIPAREVASDQAAALVTFGAVRHMHRLFMKNDLDIMTISRHGKKVLGGFFKRKKRLIRQKLIYIKKSMSQETSETAGMVATYTRMLSGKASKREQRLANAQMKDLMKGAGLGAIWLTPFIGTGLVIAVIKLGKKFGIDMLPSSFNRNDKDQLNEGSTSAK